MPNLERSQNEHTQGTFCCTLYAASCGAAFDSCNLAILSLSIGALASIGTYFALPAAKEIRDSSIDSFQTFALGGALFVAIGVSALFFDCITVQNKTPQLVHQETPFKVAASIHLLRTIQREVEARELKKMLEPPLPFYARRCAKPPPPPPLPPKKRDPSIVHEDEEYTAKIHTTSRTTVFTNHFAKTEKP